MEQLKNELETLIDKNSVATLLDAIAQICYEKEEHIKTNWQDKSTAGIWRSAGGMVSNIQDKIGC